MYFYETYLSEKLIEGDSSEKNLINFRDFLFRSFITAEFNSNFYLSIFKENGEFEDILFFILLIELKYLSTVFVFSD